MRFTQTLKVSNTLIHIYNLHLELPQLIQMGFQLFLSRCTGFHHFQPLALFLEGIQQRPSPPFLRAIEISFISWGTNPANIKAEITPTIVSVILAAALIKKLTILNGLLDSDLSRLASSREIFSGVVVMATSYLILTELSCRWKMCSINPYLTPSHAREGLLGYGGSRRSLLSSIVSKTKTIASYMTWKSLPLYPFSG